MAADPEAVQCWCFDVTIASQALDRMPAAARGVACVCAACAKGER
jgi:Cysteine-rich CWC